MNNLLAQDAATPLADSTTRLIPLSQGKFAVVDAADFEWLNQWKWTAIHQKKCDKWYAYRPVVGPDGKRTTLRLHRLIMNAPHGVEVDHKDRDGLNNSRSNLRMATHQQNLCNRGADRDGSGYKGVRLYRRTGRWVANIGLNGKTIHLGYFDTRDEATTAYSNAAHKYHGEFARVR